MIQNGRTNVFCDWLTGVDLNSSLSPFLEGVWRNSDWIPIRPAYHRQVGKQMRPSLIDIFSTPGDKDVRPIIRLTGAAMSNFRETNRFLHDAAILRIIGRNVAYFSRVDLAVDIIDEGHFARRFANHLAAGQVNIGRRKATIVSGVGEQAGTTVYVGARTSPKMCRVYDKNAESNGVVKSSRVEFELKDYAAVNIHQAVLNFDLAALLTKIFNGLLHEFFPNWQFKELSDAWWGSSIEIKPFPVSPMWSTKEWLAKSVVPTFRKLPRSERDNLKAWFLAQIDD